MAAVSSILPRIFHWVFLVLTVLAALAAFAVCIVMIIDPHLPAGLHFGPAPVNMMGQPGSIVLRSQNGDMNFQATALRGNLTMFVGKANGLFELLKRYGLPLVLTNLIFFAVLFELLRRLFGNVERGESFSRYTISLVQCIGGLLIVFSLVSAAAERLFSHAVLAYVLKHSVITISGTQVRFPPPEFGLIPHSVSFPIGSPVFFSGLLVLALSEVFRQGLALRNEHALTI